MSGRETVRQGATFAVVGIVATAAHLTAALTARDLVGMPPLAANLCGYACAVSISYLGNARLTFRTRAADAGQAARFLVTSLGVLAFNQGLVWVLVDRVGWPFHWAMGPVVVGSPVLSFAISRIWAFRTRVEAVHGR